MEKTVENNTASAKASPIESDPWFLMEVCPRSNPLMVVPPMSGFADLREFGAPLAIGYSLIDSRKGDEKLIFPRVPFSKAGQATLDKLLDDPEWGLEHNATIIKHSEVFFEKTDALLKGVDFRAKSDEELAHTYETLLELQRRSHASGLVWVVVEFDHQLLTRHLMDYLRQRIREKDLDLQVAVAFSALTTPTVDSFAQMEERSLLEIAAKIHDPRVRKLFESNDAGLIATRLGAFQPDVAKELDAHVERFAWLPYMYEGPAWDTGYFIGVLRGLVKENPQALLEKTRKRHAEIEREQKTILDSLEPDQKERILLDVAKGMVYTKGFRKDCLYHFFYRMEPFLKEVARRLGLTLGQVRRLMPYEVPAALRCGMVDANELNERYAHYARFVEPGGATLVSGKKADALLKQFNMEAAAPTEQTQELNGDCACPGYARGVVKLIEAPADMAKMNKGDILVAHATNPDIVPAMKLAGAIVTDMGGITCHAAIVSRELKIPCVIGTKVATSVLKDGELVEVDATHGKVTKIGGGEAE